MLENAKAPNEESNLFLALNGLAIDSKNNLTENRTFLAKALRLIRKAKVLVLKVKFGLQIKRFGFMSTFETEHLALIANLKFGCRF